MSTIETLRTALTVVADQAPAPEALDHSAWSATQPRAAVPRRRHRAGLAALASAAAVIAVAALALTVASVIHRSTTPAASVPTPDYARALFGPQSMPGLELHSALIGRQRQTYEFDTPGRDMTTLTLELNVVTPDTALFTAIKRGTPVTVGRVHGWYASTPGTAAGTVYDWLYGPVPAEKYQGNRNPYISTVAWPVDAHRWAILFPVYVNGVSQDLSRAALVGRAATLTQQDSEHLTPVHVGYVPAGLRFTAAYIQPTSLSAGAGPGNGCCGGPAGVFADADRMITFTSQPDVQVINGGDVTLAIEVIDGAAESLAADHDASQLPSIYGTDWHKTTINGHLAWVSSRDILIQWGSLVLGVSSTSQTRGGHVLPAAELQRVAESLQAPQASTQPGYPLNTALPPATLR